MIAKNVEGVQHCVRMQWGCTPECKAIDHWEVYAILELIKSFVLPVKELRQLLYTCDDGCPNSHYIGTCCMVVVNIKGKSVPISRTIAHFFQ